MARETIRTTIRLSSSKKEPVDEIKRIIHVALLRNYLPCYVRARKTVQQTTRWNYPYYEAKITVYTSVETDGQQTTLSRG